MPSKSCVDCAAAMPETAAFCPNCGRPMDLPARAEGKVGVLRENYAGVLAYLSFIPPIIFLLVQPYKGNRFVRFHSLQSLFACGAVFTLVAILRLVGLILFLIPVAGGLFVTLLDVLAALAVLLIWLVLIVKAFQGERFRVPFLGDLAEQYA